MGHPIPSATISRFRRHRPARQDTREPLPAAAVSRAAGMPCARPVMANTDNGPATRTTQTTEQYRTCYATELNCAAVAGQQRSWHCSTARAVTPHLAAPNPHILVPLAN